MAKSGQEDELKSPFESPAFLERGQPHLFCPVRAFRDYVECTEGASEDHLFYNSKTQKPLPPRSLVRLLCHIVEMVDPGHCPRAHSIEGPAALLVFLCTHLVERGW